MASPDPITWQLALLIQQKLQTITVSNGWRTDVGTNVLVEPTQAEAGKTLPQAVVTITKSSLTGGTAPRAQRSLIFEVEASVDANSSNAMQNAHMVLADIEKALNQSVQVGVSGVRFAMATDSEILTRPSGLDTIVVKATGRANYLPG